MIYRIYLYKTKIISPTSTFFYYINHALSNMESGGKRCPELNRLDRFDTKKIKSEIEKKITYDSKPLCKVFEKKVGRYAVSYLCIVTSYECISEVIGIVYDIAIKNNLVLYDEAKDKQYFNDLYDSYFVSVRSRANEINGIIRKTMSSVWRLRHLGSFDSDNLKREDYCVTLKKIKGVSFEERVEEFYDLLKNAVSQNEKLFLGNRCFTIKCGLYSISYTLEGYKKNADRIGYMSDGVPLAEVMNRMSCETAFKLYCKMGNINAGRRKPGFCMYKQEIVDAFPNPADRFVIGTQIRRYENKEKYKIRYDGCYGGAVSFFPVPNPYNLNYETSGLHIEETDAIPLLDIIRHFYPYFSTRYYGCPNIIPFEMMIDITGKMKYVKQLILNDTYSEELKPYVNHKTFMYASVMNDVEYDRRFNEDTYLDVVYEKRYEVIRIYDVFVNWVEAQIRTYDDYQSGLSFDMKGP